jgi:Flp pilus assembly pilin Flp
MLSRYLKIKCFLDEEIGQTSVEYAAVVVVLALALIAVSPGLGNALATFFGKVTTKLNALVPA